MSSRSASATVSAPPRRHVAPPLVSTAGDIACDFAASYKLDPDPWQRLVLDDWLATTPDGIYASLTCGLSVSRQNGKNAALEVRELFGMIFRDEKFLHTAHQVKTAQKHFRRLKHFFGKKANDESARYPDLNELVLELRNVNGQEAIILHDRCDRCSYHRPRCECDEEHDEYTPGGSVEIVARSQGSGRGFTVDIIVCDEAQDMSDEDLEALLSTSSASPSGNPQWIFTGTPPGPKASGEVFTRIREEILTDKAGASCWHEWAAADDADLDDPAVWLEANPGLATGRLLMNVVVGERQNLSDEGFARERLGMWTNIDARRVIDSASWNTIADPSSMAIDRLTLAVDVAPDRSIASVALAGQRADGLWHVELDEQRAGTGWVVPWIKARIAKNKIRAVVIDAISPASSLLEEFATAKIKVTVTTSRDMANACGQFYDGVMDARFKHTDQPQVNAALAVAGKRPLVDAWAWNRKTATADITPLVAETLALWGARKLRTTRPGNGRGRSSSRKATVL